MSVARVISHATGLLDHQRAALLSGDIPRLTALAPQIEAMGKALETAQPDAAEQASIARLKSLAARNAQLMKSAMDGLAAARRTIMRPRDTDFASYDAGGRMSVLGQHRPSMEKRS